MKSERKTPIQHINACLSLCKPMDYTDYTWNSPGQNTLVSSFLQGIFPIQGSNPGLLHCRQILYQLSHKGSPAILVIL